MMLHHLGEQHTADKIKNAWLCTLENRIYTEDIFQSGQNAERVGTRAFADAVIEQLGNEPKTFRPTRHSSEVKMTIQPYKRRPAREKTLDGVDVFIHWSGENVDDLAARIATLHPEFKLLMITNRGVKVWPNGFEETFCTDHWRCRFEKTADVISNTDVAQLLSRMAENGVDFIKTEHLYRFDGDRAYSLGQGQ